MYTVYIIQSQINNKYYIGHTSDLTKRLLEHNAGLTSSTAKFKPWNLVYQKQFQTKGFAQHIELKIKRMKSRVFIKKLINLQIDDSFFV